MSARGILATPLLGGSRAGRLAARLLLYGTALFGGVPVAFSFMLTGAARQPVHAAVAPYEEAYFDSRAPGRPPVRLRAWRRGPDGVVPRPPRPAVVAVHGMGDSLESFTGTAERYAARGHVVLLLDLRGHGGSGQALATLGAHERYDVRAALDHLLARGDGRAGFVLVGNSLGGVTVLLAAAGREDVRAVVAEAPFDSYRETVAHHAGLYYRLPRWFPLWRPAIALAEWRAGFDADEVDVMAAAARVEAPVMLIAGGADARMPEAVVRRVLDAREAARPGRTSFWVAPDAPHCGAWMHAEYWPRVLAFLESAGA